jgi:hypothetical protein
MGLASLVRTGVVQRPGTVERVEVVVRYVGNCNLVVSALSSEVGVLLI